jgi:hypothetical protein
VKRWIRVILIVLTASVGLSATTGGLALIVDSAASSSGGGVVPDLSYLEGSPFNSYAAPGIILATVVGGTHILAALLVGRGAAKGAFATSIAAFSLLIWIFVQMMFIPFSPLQAVYFAAGLVELGLLLLDSDLFVRGRRATS